MIEAIVASLLNRYLGKYVKDLDSENVNIGIFSGKVELEDLRLRPEALVEFDLPVEVKAGNLGKVLIEIPWTNLYSQSVSVVLEDLFLLAGPISERPYNEEQEKQLNRAAKQQKLEFLESTETFSIDESEHDRSFVEKLSATIINNLQISIRNVHIRYEDSISDDKSPLACGIVLHGLSAETTNKQWKPTQLESTANSIYKLVKLKSFSVYWNPFCDYHRLTGHELVSDSWINIMKQGLERFSVNNEEFDFIIKPISAKVKMIVNKTNEAKVPKLLLDFVLKDIDAQISRQQYLSFMNLLESFQCMRINQRYRRYRPTLLMSGKTSKWWKYAFNSILEESIRPFAWKRIKQHREKYHDYMKMYMKKLQNPSDAEVKVDLQKLEDNLDLLNIVIAREQARLEFSKLEPENIHPKKPPRNWWRNWFFSQDCSKEQSFEIVGERDRNIWHQLTSDDKQKIYDAIGYTEGEKFNEKPVQYIENKLNFTFANCTLSLKSYDKEILVTTLTQLLLSLETRPAANAFHFSARAESFIIEGTSVENDLAPIITADPVTSGTTMPHVLAIDFEKNPLHINADYGLSVHSEAIEVVYHEHAITEVLTFLQAPTTTFNDVIDIAADKISSFVNVSRAALEYAIETHKKIYLNLEMKSPHFIIPEYGNIQKGGSVIVMDFGHLTMKSELQTDNRLLEDATRTELEERLYDRYNITLSEIQALFADSGDEWRTAKTLPESDSHLIPKFSVQIIFSNSVKPDYRQLPRHKLNISLPTLKLNLSDRRVKLLSEFCFNLPIPKPKVCYSTDAESVDGVEKMGLQELNMSEVIVEPTLLELQAVRHYIQAINLQKEMQLNESVTSNVSKQLNEKGSPVSEQSDEEAEQWARIVDLPGFDDNVSPSNAIVMLLRFLIGELVVQLARSSDHVDKPYLMLRIDKLCMDIALMECGPALQANIGAIQLVDKLHTGLSGEYLELIRSRHNSDVITILYRKVRSDCPDFKTYFHSVEQSVVIDFTCMHLLFHRGAFFTLSNFLEYLSQRIGSKASAHLKSSPMLNINPTQLLLSNEHDPPVPPGATKLSISARLDEIKVKLCDSDVDFLEIQLAGVETDLILKANEKFILRAQLTTLEIEDLSDLTLYPKILTIKEDKVFDFKYVRHSSSHHKQQEIEHSSRGFLGDANLRLRIGKIHVTLLHKFIANLQRFLDPFIHPHMAVKALRSAEKEIQHQVKEIRNQGMKILMSIDIQIPTILIPQKSDSPSVLVVSLGNLSMENFFHEVTVSNSDTKHIVDSLLLRLNSIQISRALIGINGVIDVQEMILEPTKLRLDVKRALAPYHREVLLYDVHGSLETAKLNIGPKDVSLLYGIFKENFTEGHFVENHPSSHPSTPIEIVTPTITGDDSTIKRLQAFLNYSCDFYKVMAFSFTLDGLYVKLFTDADEEVLSPNGNKQCGLSTFNMEEVTLSLESFSDKSTKVKCALQAITVRDTRPDPHLAIRKIFQSYSGDSKVDMGMISLSMPPMIDITYKMNPTGDVEVDILIEKTRLNVSIPYVLAIMKFLYDAIPLEKPADGGIINPGFTEEMNKDLSGSHVKPKRQISISESTSGYHSTSSSALDDVPAISLTAKLKKPEIVLFANPNDKHSRVLVIKTDAFLDYNRNATQDNLVASIANLQVLSCVYGRRKQTAYMVLKPCDIEFSHLAKSMDEGTQMTALLSVVDFRLSASTVHTILDISEELTGYFKSDKNEVESSKTYEQHVDLEGLWTPQKISPLTWINNINNADEKYVQASYPKETPQEKLVVNIPAVFVTCELETTTERIPVLQLKTSLEADVNNWSKQMFMKAALRLELSCYNEHLNVWEPLIEPVMHEENVYRPWEVLIKMFQQPAHPISGVKADEDLFASDTTCNDYASVKLSTLSESESSGNETESETGMTIIKKPRARQTKRIYAQKSHDSNSVVGCRVDSDSENEEGILDKIADAFGHMFSSDSSEGEPSESEEDVVIDAKSDAEDTDTADPEASLASGEDARPVFLRKQITTSGDDETDSGIDDVSEKLATYVLIDARDKLDITLTPAAANIISAVAESFTQRHNQYHYFYKASESSIELQNEIGPQAKIAIIEKARDGLSDEEIVIQTSTSDDAENDLPVSPASTALLVDVSPGGSDVELESDEVDRFSISSALDHVGCADISEEALVYDEADVTTLYQETTRQRINIEVDGFDKLQCLLPNIESSHVYPLHPSQNDTCYHVIVDVAIRCQHKSVVVRSPLQIHNTTNQPFNVYYKRVTLEALKLSHPVQPKNPFDENICLTILQPDEMYSVPLFIAYHCKLYIQPAYMNYAVSSSGVWWQEISVGQNNTCSIHCPANDEVQPGFHVKVSCEEGIKLKYPSPSGTRYIPNYKITIHPPLIIYNQLPYEVELKFQKFAHNEKLDPGNRVAVYNIDLNKKEQVKVEVSTYLGIPWNGTLDLSAHIDDNKSITMLTDYDTEGGNKQLGLNVHVEHEHSLELYFFAPYWIVNKTGLPLQFRGTNSDMVYESQTTEEPLLFRFKRHRRKRVRVRVYNSHWSTAFSLDTVGSSGVVICKDKERNKKYLFLLNITLTKLHLTKIVTITPYFIVVNKTRHYLRYMEENEKADLWFDIAPSQVCSYWPDTDSSKMFLKYRDSNKVSQHFPLNIEHSTVLRMDRGTAICVDVHGGLDSPVIITFYSYTHGEAPVRIDNMCEDIFLKIHQKSMGQVMLLNPYQSLLYTWDDPTVERTLFWNVYNRNKPGLPIFLNKDCFGHEKVSFHMMRQASNSARLTKDKQSSSDEDDSENGSRTNGPRSQKTRKDKVVVYWVSYLDGHQRTILFTQDEKLAKSVNKFSDLEKSTLECFVSFQNVGVSLVNTLYQEIAYLSLAGSPAIWEVDISGKWKLLSVELSTWLEDKWRADQLHAQLKDYIQVNLSKMQMTKPFFGQLRRKFYPALWLQYRQSHHQSYIHFRVHKFQIDNQLQDAIFPIVLHPSPIPIAITKKSGPKPFIEFVMLQHHMLELNFRSVKYLKALVQEFNLKLDKGFLLSLYDMLSSSFFMDAEDTGLKADLTAIHSALKTGMGKIPRKPHRTVFEYVHLCPLKIIFSFSPRGIVHKETKEPKSWQKDFVNFFTSSISATLSEMKDIELKMTYFEKRGIVVNPRQLLDDVRSHYKMEFVQQVYVLIFGLDILGNPYGLVKDFMQGFGDFFYEPFMGTIKRPEEYADAISFGAQSLLGHVVGSTAGSVSLITGSLGQTLAALSCDEDYKQRRRMQLQQYKSLPEMVIAASRTFSLGVALGISGIFTKPVTGAQLEGVEGFFKGIGKGLLGILVKPAGGVLDIVTMAFDGIRRIAEMGEDVIMQSRLPRYLNPRQGIRPYSPYKASGNRLLQLLSRGHYSENDIYFTHAALKKEDCSDVVLITDRHVFLLEKSRFWGGWDIEWIVRVDDIMAVPRIEGNSLVIKIKQDESFNMYSKNEQLIACDDAVVLQWLADKIEKVLLYNMADKPCPLMH